MANDFVKTITTNNGTTYDIQDARLTVTAADAGKVVSVDSNGNLSLVTPSGGTKLYKHSIYIEDVNTETDTGYFYVNIISTSNISVNDYNKLSNCLTNATSSSFTIDKAGDGTEPMIGSVISMLGGNTIGIYGYSVADERQHAFEFELSLISDTVTELN